MFCDCGDLFSSHHCFQVPPQILEGIQFQSQVMSESLACILTLLHLLSFRFLISRKSFCRLFPFYNLTNRTSAKAKASYHQQRFVQNNSQNEISLDFLQLLLLSVTWHISILGHLLSEIKRQGSR